MSEGSAEGVQGPAQTQDAGQAAAADTAKAGKKGSTAGYTQSTLIHSTADLKKKAPEVHKAMLEGIAQTIVRQQQKHLRRMKELMRKNREG